MFQPRRDRFLKHGLRNHFGEEVEAVGACLLSYGRQTMRDVASRLEPPMPHKQLVQCLLVLIQHGLVKADLDESTKTEAKYELDINMFHYRMLFPNYLAHVQRVFGGDSKDGGTASLIVEIFCKHGKLTRKTVLKMATRELVFKKYTLENRPKDQKEELKEITKCFEKLVKCHYLRRADSLTEQFADEIRVPRKRKVGMEDVRKIVPSKRRKRVGKVAAQPEIALLSYETLHPHTFVTSEEEDDNMFWQVYHQKFMAQFQNEAIIDYVKARTEDEPSHKLVAKLLKRYPVSGNVDRSKYTVRDIHNLARLGISSMDLRNKIDNLYSLGILKTSLGSRGGDPDASAMLLDVKADNRAYEVAVEDIVQELKLQHAQAIAREKFGEQGARIFRLLIAKKRLEEKQITEMGIMPKKQTRELLHKMMRAGMTHVQDIPKDSQRRPNRMMHLWTVTFTKVCKTLMDSFYFTWVNLSIRTEKEAVPMKPVLDKANHAIPWTPSEKESVERWTKANIRLRNSMMKVGMLIQLFRDFE